MVGSKLGSYEIREQIGQGGMATVYRAYQPGIDRDVAIKVMRDYTDQLRSGREPVFDRKKFPEIDKQLEDDVW